MTLSILVSFEPSANVAPPPSIKACTTAIKGVVLWAIGLAAVESIGTATVGLLAPPSRLRRAHAIYHAVRGVSWCAGSITIGVIADVSPMAAAVVGAVAIAGASLALLLADRAARSRHGAAELR